VTADPSTCSVQFNPVGTSKFTSPCDVAKAALVKRGVPYSNEQRGHASGRCAEATDRATPSIRVGTTASRRTTRTAPDAKAQGAAFDRRSTAR
jgi:hypothetical protein